MHPVLFLLFLLYLSIWHYMYTDKNPNSFDFDAIFPNWMGTGTSTNG